MSDTYKLVLNKPGYYQFTMPDGFEPAVEIYTWGAGGGSGSGAPGGGGGYAYSNISIASGSTVSVIVGGTGGSAPGGRWSPGSSGGQGASIGFNGGSGAAQGDPEDGDAGGAGGGGGATAVLINSAISVVAAGGAGGGGLGEDWSGGATAGLPGGVYVGQATGVYPVTLSYAWCAFMNSYAVWGNGQDYTTVINFPTTGTYTFNYSVDNYGQVYLDGSSIISYSTFTAFTTYTQTVSAGNHTVRVTGVNTGGPAGVALQILKPDSSELWNTRYLIVSDGLTDDTNGQNGTQGGSGGAGGGGGGYRGGETGVAYGDDQGGGGGGNGGLNYGDIIISGTDQTSGGAGLRAVYGVPPSTGDATYDGYAILIFTRKMRMFNKIDNGNVQIIFSGNITAGVGSHVVQGGSNANAIVITGTNTGNTLSLSYTTANVFTLLSGNVKVNGIFANVYPISSSNLGNWKSIEKIYYKTPVAGTLSNVEAKIFSTVNITSSGRQTRNFTASGLTAFVVPSGVTSIDVSMLGGGGGGGGNDSASGHFGYPGDTLSGILSVSPGDVITVDVGGGGATGATTPGSGGSPGGVGGVSATGYNGGQGGSAGGSGWSGGGGGGGGATVIKKNGTTIAVAAGGGGGGGGGNGDPGRAQISGYSGTSAGGAGQNKSGDGGGGGGGGGGDTVGGAGGTCPGGDSGAYSGANGSDKIPSGWTNSVGSNGGGATVNGNDGSVVFQYNVVGVDGELWTVPAGVKQLTVNYPTPSGMAVKLFPVTAGEIITVRLGDFGVDSTVTGTAGTLTLPAFDTQVFSYSGNVDHIIAQDVQVATDTGAPMSVGGSNATITAAAASAGIYYNVTYEGWHGDLYAEINFTPVLKSMIFQPVQVYTPTGSGRGYPFWHTYQQQPSADNNYVMNDYQGDYYGGEGGFSWSTHLQQQGYISINYDKAYAPGTWIPVAKVYYKDGDWKPMTSSSLITLTKLS